MIFVNTPQTLLLLCGPHYNCVHSLTETMLYCMLSPLKGHRDLAWHLHCLPLWFAGAKEMNMNLIFCVSCLCAAIAMVCGVVGYRTLRSPKTDGVMVWKEAVSYIYENACALFTKIQIKRDNFVENSHVTSWRRSSVNCSFRLPAWVNAPSNPLD